MLHPTKNPWLYRPHTTTTQIRSPASFSESFHQPSRLSITKVSAWLMSLGEPSKHCSNDFVIRNPRKNVEKFFSLLSRRLDYWIAVFF